VSGTGTSHANGLPFAQGSSVTPSGRLPSSRLRPAGSFAAGISALLNARHRILLYYYYYYVKKEITEFADRYDIIGLLYVAVMK